VPILPVTFFPLFNMLGSSMHSPPPPPPEPPPPEELLKGYRWPATRLTKADMMKLTELRSERGVPITQLLHEAVSAYHLMLTDGNEEPETES